MRERISEQKREKINGRKGETERKRISERESILCMSLFIVFFFSFLFVGVFGVLVCLFVHLLFLRTFFYINKKIHQNFGLTTYWYHILYWYWYHMPGLTNPFATLICKTKNKTKIPNSEFISDSMILSDMHLVMFFILNLKHN